MLQVVTLAMGQQNIQEYDIDYPSYRLFYYIEKYNLKPDNKNKINEKAKQIALKSIEVFIESGTQVKSQEGYDSSRYFYCYLAIGNDN